MLHHAGRTLGVTKETRPRRWRPSSRAAVARERSDGLEARRKPLARLEGRRRMPVSGLTIAWRGTPGLDDWVAFIAKTKSKRLILADRASERKVKSLLTRARTMSKREVEKLAKG
jgi:hypothetical protein